MICIAAQPTDIAHTHATGGGYVSGGGSTVTARGLCWGTTATPTITGSHVACGSGDGAFLGAIISLLAGQTYYVRAYATVSGTTSYSAAVTFNTLAASPLPATIQAEDFRDFVLDIAGVAALVAARMYIMSAPANDPLPRLIYAIVDKPDHTTDGPTGHGIATATVDCWAAGYVAAKQIADLISAGLDGYIGAMGEIAEVKAIVQSATDIIEAPTDGGEVGAKGVRIVADLWY